MRAIACQRHFDSNIGSFGTVALYLLRILRGSDFQERLREMRKTTRELSYSTQYPARCTHDTRRSSDDSQPRTLHQRCAAALATIHCRAVRCLKSGNWTLSNASRRTLIGLVNKLVFARVR
jgi:hypothetical protein